MTRGRYQNRSKPCSISKASPICLSIAWSIRQLWKKSCANGDKKMPDLRIIDIDCHVREADDLYEKYLEAPFRGRAPRVEKVANGQLLFRLEGDRHHRKPDETPFRIKEDGSPANENRHLATDPKQRLAAMDRDRIERGLLFS